MDDEKRQSRGLLARCACRRNSSSTTADMGARRSRVDEQRLRPSTRYRNGFSKLVQPDCRRMKKVEVMLVHQKCWSARAIRTLGRPSHQQHTALDTGRRLCLTRLNAGVIAANMRDGSRSEGRAG